VTFIKQPVHLPVSNAVLVLTR